MNIKQFQLNLVMSFMVTAPTMALAEGHKISDAEVNTEDSSVSLDQHFPKFEAISQKTAALKLGSVESASAILPLGLSMMFRKWSRDNIAAAAKSDAIIAGEKAFRARGWKLAANGSLALGLVILADSVTGAVMVFEDRKPIFFGNIPGLATYVVRKSKQSLTDGKDAAVETAEQVRKNIEAEIASAKATADKAVADTKRVASDAVEGTKRAAAEAVSETKRVSSEVATDTQRGISGER